MSALQLCAVGLIVPVAYSAGLGMGADGQPIPPQPSVEWILGSVTLTMVGTVVWIVRTLVTTFQSAITMQTATMAQQTEALEMLRSSIEQCTKSRTP